MNRRVADEKVDVPLPQKPIMGTLKIAYVSWLVYCSATLFVWTGSLAVQKIPDLIKRGPRSCREKPTLKPLSETIPWESIWPLLERVYI